MTQITATEPAASSRRALTVLAICFLLGLTGRGLLESFTVFLLPLSQSFGWDRASVVSIFSLSMITTGVTAPIVGRLFDRYGPRIVYGIGLGLLGLGLSAAPFAERLWHFQLCLGLTAGFAATCLGNVPNGALLGRWFGKRLTTAMSVVYSAFGLGVLVLVPATQALIDALGWRGAYHVLGAGVLAMTVPVLLLPWRLYGAGNPGLAPRGGKAAETGWTLSRAMRTSGFWGLFLVFMLTSLGMYAITVQGVAYLVEIGFPAMQAAAAWGSTGILLPLGMIAVGWLDGLIGRRASVILSYIVSLTGMVLLLLLGHYPSVWLLTSSVVCFGSTLGSRGPLIASIALRLFPGRHAATILGAISIGSGIGSAGGTWIGGLLHDLTGRYDYVIGFSIISIIGGMVTFVSVPALRR